LRRAGKRTRAFLGTDDVECHWGTTLGQMIRVLEKNFFAATDFRLWLVLVGGVVGILIFCAVVFGLLTGTAAGLAAGLAPLSLILPAGILARRIGWSWWCAGMTPLIYPVLWYAMLNSTVVT